MKILLLAALPLMLLGQTMLAQTININLDHLAPKAKEKTEVTLSGDLLQLALKAKPEEAEKLKGITSVVVRVYEFAKAGEYTEADVESVRKQASGAGWSKVISVKEQNESTDISVYSQGGQIQGLLVIAAEQTELTIVHIQGAVDLARMNEVVASTVKFDMESIAQLQGQ